MEYRAEIDGLRALAVIPVILFHAGFTIFSGGFIGVDIFFVISGYLITSILINDIQKNRFSITGFYERRARRILPALFFVMLCCIPFAWAWMLPDELIDFSESLIAVVLFLSNFLFSSKNDYFDTSSEEAPLLHTWSLSVEEQYYIAFPIFLFFFWRFGRQRVFWIIVTLAGISLALSEWGWRNKPTENFYYVLTRAWEIFAGSIAAFIINKHDIKKNNFLASAGLCAVLFSIFAYDETTPFPSLYALLPVFGVVLIVLYADKDTFAAKILSTKPLVGIGIISYSAYLWHQPIFAFAHIRSLTKPSSEMMIFLSIASILLAIISWKYIERPFRNKNIVSRPIVVRLTASFAIFFISIGLGVKTFSTEIEYLWASLQPDERRVAFNLIKKVEAHHRIGKKDEVILSDCRFNIRTISNPYKEKINNCHKHFGKGYLILGDSHAIDLFGVVTSRFDHPFIVGVTQGGCRPGTTSPSCHYDKVKEYVANNPGVFSKIIYEQAGFYLLKTSTGSSGNREMFSSLDLNMPVDQIYPDKENISVTLTYLSELSRHLPVDWLLPRAEPHISHNMILKKGCEFEWRFRKNQLETFLNLDDVIADMIDKAKSKNLKWISQNQLFEFDLKNDFMACNALYWSDGDHFSEEGERRFGKRLPSSFIES